MPSNLPQSAYDIREAHDAEGNRRWGLFSFPSSDADALRAILRPNELSLGGMKCDMPARIEWWPLLLRDEFDPEKIRIAGLEAYASRQDELVVAVNWSQGRAYYWTR